MNFATRFLIGLCTIALISSCGWQLRGSQNITNVSAVHISAKQANSGVALSVQRALQARDIALADDATDASHSIVIINQTEKRRTLSVSGSGKASEFLLSKTVEFVILDSDGKQLSDKQSISAQRAFDHDESRPLAKSTEERLLQTEISQDLAAGIIRALGRSGQ